LLLAQRFDAEARVVPAAWADAVAVEVGEVGQFPARVANCPLAIIACRTSGSYASVAAGRAECDRLQRDLAGLGDWAGYIV
jgi:hypothetical protein